MQRTQRAAQGKTHLAIQARASLTLAGTSALAATLTQALCAQTEGPGSPSRGKGGQRWGSRVRCMHVCMHAAAAAVGSGEDDDWACAVCALLQAQALTLLLPHCTRDCAAALDCIAACVSAKWCALIEATATSEKRLHWFLDSCYFLSFKLLLVQFIRVYPACCHTPFDSAVC